MRCVGLQDLGGNLIKTPMRRQITVLKTYRHTYQLSAGVNGQPSAADLDVWAHCQLGTLVSLLGDYGKCMKVKSKELFFFFVMLVWAHA